MLRIGEFSKLSRVTVKTLRWYDEVGLLKPSQIDEETSYRYYSVDQLPRLNRILALKSLGFSLEQITSILDSTQPDELLSLMRRRRDELEQQIAIDRDRLAQVEFRLIRIQEEGTVSDYEVVIKSIEPALAATVRDTLQSYADVGRLYGEIYPHIGRQGVMGGQCGAIWHDPEYKETDIDGEAVVFVNRKVKESERVKVRELAGIRSAACLIHKGSYKSLDKAYAAMSDWITANGYRITGPNRELYLKGGPKQDDESYVTELQFPVEKS